MNYKTGIFTFFITLIISSCINNYLPGFDFKLFNGTPVEELASAVKSEDVDEINEILKDSNINVDFQESKYGHTLLMLAVANNKVKSVEALLKNGANPNLKSKDDEDNSITIFAENYSQTCDTTIISLLLQYGGDINSIQYIDRIENNGMHSHVKETSLMISISNYCIEVIKFMVDKGADINQYTYYDGYGTITEAILNEKLDVLKYLIIEKQANIPAYCFVRPAIDQDSEKYLTITDFLNEQKYERGSEDYELRKEIIEFLQSKNLK
jgi:uncharacterized protein